jgi:hypothetical protein
MALVLVSVFIFLLNLVFGYWRSNTRKFSISWFLSIHVPVPIAIVSRLIFLGWNLALLPIFVGVFAAGQYTGGKLRNVLSRVSGDLGSFLLGDLVAIWQSKRPRLDPD